MLPFFNGMLYLILSDDQIAEVDVEGNIQRIMQRRLRWVGRVLATIQFSLVHPKGICIASMRNGGRAISPLNCPVVFIQENLMIIVIYYQYGFSRTLIHKNGYLSTV